MQREKREHWQGLNCLPFSIDISPVTGAVTPEGFRVLGLTRSCFPGHKAEITVLRCYFATRQRDDDDAVPYTHTNVSVRAFAMLPTTLIGTSRSCSAILQMRRLWSASPYSEFGVDGFPGGKVVSFDRLPEIDGKNFIFSARQAIPNR